MFIVNNTLSSSKLQIDYLLFYWYGLSQGYLVLFKLKAGKSNSIIRSKSGYGKMRINKRHMELCKVEARLTTYVG